MARLTDDEIDRYRADGWVVPAWRLPARRTDEMRDALDALLRDNPGVRPEKLVSAHIEGDNGEGVRGSRAFLDLARDPEIVELVSGVLGEDVILWGCHVFCKPAVEGYETPWHQDGHYWPIRPLATCTVWVALEESKVENKSVWSGEAKTLEQGYKRGDSRRRVDKSAENVSCVRVEERFFTASPG